MRYNYTPTRMVTIKVTRTKGCEAIRSNGSNDTITLENDSRFSNTPMI